MNVEYKPFWDQRRKLRVFLEYELKLLQPCSYGVVASMVAFRAIDVGASPARSVYCLCNIVWHYIRLSAEKLEFKSRRRRSLDAYLSLVEGWPYMAYWRRSVPVWMGSNPIVSTNGLVAQFGRALS